MSTMTNIPLQFLDMYKWYKWLEYSIAKDSVFCYPCRLFGHESNKAEERFVTLGYRDWKHAGGNDGAFAKHHTSKNNKEALMNWSQYKLTVAMVHQLLINWTTPERNRLRRIVTT